MSERPLRRVRCLPHVEIPLSDGTLLGARLWLPEDEEPVPALLEYIPYRKGDATAPRDATLHPWLAARGYGCARVDLRGSGDSEGVLRGEYLEQELADGVEVIRWLAAAPWCTGRVGMIGKSWGGFNGLQLAALAPPELGAVVSVCSTDDRYADDVHMTGGALFAQAALSWSTTMLAYSARPPDPAAVGERWRELWQQRLDEIEPFGHEWLRHPSRDDFWRHGSVCEDPGAIRCPIYMVGGWADPYRGAVLRMLAAAPDRVQGLIGPWAHVYPYAGAPGPAVGFLDLCRRFFDRHLRGEGAGLDDEPALRAWMPDPIPPSAVQPERPGRWIAEQAWPPASASRRLALGRSGIGGPPEPSAERTVRGVLAHGSDGPTWLPWGAPGDFAADQRAEDGRALCLDSEPLDARLEILGVAALELELIAAATSGQLAVRLCDVAADGSSFLVSQGVLDLTHREGHETPQPLPVGIPTAVRLELAAIAHAFPAGHRLRLALAPCLWPWAWPDPAPLELRVRLGGAAMLELPVREPHPRDAELPPLGPPDGAAPLAAEQLRPVHVRRSTRRELWTGTLESTSELSYFGGFRLADGLEYDEHGLDRFCAQEGDPLSARAESAWTISVRRGAWRTRVECRSTLACDETSYIAADELRAFLAGELVAHRRWQSRVPRR